MLSFQQLKNDCRRPPWTDGILPHARQNLSAMRALVENAFDHNSSGCLLGSSESIVVLMTDGVSYNAANDCWSPSTLGALTSVFPSTSSSAILAAITGLLPEEHGIIGVAFYVPELDAVFDCLRDCLLSALDQRPVSGNRKPAFCEWPTVFTSLKDRVDCVVHLGAIYTIPGLWSRAVVNGARLIKPKVDWNIISGDPVAMIRAVIEELDETLSVRRTRPLLTWAHVNIDSAIHINGYDSEVYNALDLLGRSAERWASNGTTVIAHSDHGLVKTYRTERTDQLLDLLQDPSYCAQPSGGAGRVMWAYPHQKSARDLLKRIYELAEDFALVIERDEFLQSGAIANTQVARDRIGEILIVATGPEFPLLSSNVNFEHGAFSEEEMFVPVATWMGR